MNATDRVAREFASALIDLYEDSGCGGIADEMTLDQLEVSNEHGPVVQAARSFLAQPNDATELVAVPRDALVSVCDSLAEWANRRGELHDGLTTLLPYLSDTAEQGATTTTEPVTIGPEETP